MSKTFALHKSKKITSPGKGTLSTTTTSLKFVEIYLFSESQNYLTLNWIGISLTGIIVCLLV